MRHSQIKGFLISPDYHVKNAKVRVNNNRTCTYKNCTYSLARQLLWEPNFRINLYEKRYNSRQPSKCIQLKGKLFIAPVIGISEEGKDLKIEEVNKNLFKYGQIKEIAE